MLLPIPDLLSPAELAAVHGLIGDAEWIDGNATSGHQARLVKHNLQLPETSDAALRAGQIVLGALARNSVFISAALPAKIYPPMFNSYCNGQTYGLHVDNAVRVRPDGTGSVRADLSVTVFLENPARYDGGELTLETALGAKQVKLPAGHAVLYPATALHKVEPVTRGRRVASFFWVQSLVSDERSRTALFDLDQSIQQLGGDVGQGNPALVRLTGVYHNLLRRWAEC